MEMWVFVCEIMWNQNWILSSTQNRLETNCSFVLKKAVSDFKVHYVVLEEYEV